MNNQQKAEVRYCPAKEELYIVGHDWGFAWYPHEIEQVIKSYESGLHVSNIADQIGRSVTDTFLLLLDLAERERIDKRTGWIWGKDN